MAKVLAQPGSTTIEELIKTIRGQRIILDSDLAKLYGTETKVLVQAIKRNLNRFPGDFMFQLTREEFASLRSQIVTSKGRGGRRHLPYAFTEHGVIMVANILNSDRAVRASPAFTRLNWLCTKSCFSLISGHEVLQRSTMFIASHLNNRALQRSAM